MPTGLHPNQRLPGCKSLAGERKTAAVAEENALAKRLVKNWSSSGSNKQQRGCSSIGKSVGLSSRKIGVRTPVFPPLQATRSFWTSKVTNAARITSDGSFGSNPVQAREHAPLIGAWLPRAAAVFAILVVITYRPCNGAGPAGLAETANADGTTSWNDQCLVTNSSPFPPALPSGP